jgi:hypothetical protein
MVWIENPPSRPRRLIGERARKVKGAWKVTRRTIVLDANVLLDKNLSVFLWGSAAAQNRRRCDARFVFAASHK